MTQTPETLLFTADISINTSTQQVFKNKRLLNIPDLSYQVLMALINAAPDVISSDDLIDQAWQSVEVSQETLTQRIALLRKALAGEGEKHETYIKSVRNKGYRWVPAVKQKTNSKYHYWLLGLVALFFIPLIYLLAFQDENSAEIPAVISSQANVDDYTQQAWRYLDKHEASSNDLAIGLFRKSLAADPQHLNALTGLSIALSHQVTKFNQADELLVEAKQVAELAIALEPNHAQAWAALAFVYDAMGELTEAVSRYEKALAINPSNSSTASSLSYLYGEQGRLVEALKLNLEMIGSRQLYLDLQIAQVLDLLGFDAVAEQWYVKADELSPDNVFATHLRARYYLSRNQFQQANEVIDAAIDRGIVRPELPLLKGIIAWIQGDSNTASVWLEQAVAIDATDTEVQVLLFILNNPDGAPEDLIQAFENQWFTPPYTWPNLWVYQTLFYAHFGDDEEALNSLQQAYQTGYRNHRWLQQLPPLQKYHTNKQWLNMIEAIQNDVSQQRQAVLQADWLPTSFLDPKN